MRKNYFVLVAVLVISLFTSCSSDEDVVVNASQSPKNVPTVEETRLMFEAWADSILVNSTEVGTKGPILSKFKKIWRYASADAKCARVGAQIGASMFVGGPAAGGIGVAASAVVFGAMGSYLKYQVDVIMLEPVKENLKAQVSQVTTTYQNTKPDDIDYIDFGLPNWCEHLSVVAGMHNAILSNLIETGSTPSEGEEGFAAPVFTDPTNVAMCKSVVYNDYLATKVTSLSEYNAVEATVLTSSSFVTSCEDEMLKLNTEYLEKVETAKTDEEMLSYMLYPEEEAKVSYMKTIINSYLYSILNVVDFDSMIDLTDLFIEKSNKQVTLTYDEKIQLTTFFTVFANSSIYWNGTLD